MKQNVYVAQDKISGRGYRIIFADNDGTLCRDNVQQDLRSEKNPIGLPFKDLAYLHIAVYDTENFTFENVPARNVDILKSYEFKVEKEVVKESVDKPLPEVDKPLQ